MVVIWLNEADFRSHQLIMLLKVQKSSALNESSKKAIEFIKEFSYEMAEVKEVEKQLIIATERHN